MGCNGFNAEEWVDDILNSVKLSQKQKDWELRNRPSTFVVLPEIVDFKLDNFIINEDKLYLVDLEARPHINGVGGSRFLLNNYRENNFIEGYKFGNGCNFFLENKTYLCFLNYCRILAKFDSENIKKHFQLKINDICDGVVC